ncbi:MAG: DUF1015 domain-containing protein [Acidobacteria bacterium]|nr:DUF1015 domain-containing protein [Acidobacteriota bacterium]
MTAIKPFRALRPAPEQAKQVSCVPYDVVYEQEVRAFISENPLSFLRVTRPEAEFPENESPDSLKIFARARENLQKFINEEIFLSDPEPSIYLYRLSTDTHTQTGVVACCSLDEYELGEIKKHEKTRPDKVKDRTGHMVALNAQTGLIFLAFRNTQRIKELILQTTREETPLYDFRCVEGVKQTIWRVARTDDFVEGFAEVPALYIADGHHRVESARLARDILRKKNPRHTGAEDYNFVVAGMFPAEDLRILAYNRVVKDFNNLTEAEFFQKASENFSITETNEKVPSSKNEFCLFTGAKWYKLKFAAERARQLNVIESLDVSILQNFLLAPILGIEDPRTDQRIEFVGGARGTDELEKLVSKGTAKLAVSMFPTTMDELFAISDVNEIMPPKSTWFEPKLKDGLLVHLF